VLHLQCTGPNALAETIAWALPRKCFGRTAQGSCYRCGKPWAWAVSGVLSAGMRPPRILQVHEQHTHLWPPWHRRCITLKVAGSTAVETGTYAMSVGRRTTLQRDKQQALMPWALGPVTLRVCKSRCPCRGPQGALEVCEPWAAVLWTGLLLRLLEAWCCCDRHWIPAGTADTWTSHVTSTRSQAVLWSRVVMSSQALSLVQGCGRADSRRWTRPCCRRVTDSCGQRCRRCRSRTVVTGVEAGGCCALVLMPLASSGAAMRVQEQRGPAPRPYCCRSCALLILDLSVCR